MTEKSNIPPKPEKPSPHECCGSGCVPCIYDYYYEALEKWNERYSEQQSQTNTEPQNPKSQGTDS